MRLLLTQGVFIIRLHEGGFKARTNVRHVGVFSDTPFFCTNLQILGLNSEHLFAVCNEKALKTFISKKTYAFRGAVGGKGKQKPSAQYRGVYILLIIVFYSALLPSYMLTFYVLYRFALSKG